jgi:hypothetical protein
MTTLKPCPHHHADDEGHILCDKIKAGDREVSPNVCRACPVAAINCTHLRATLDHHAHLPITIRWGNGKTDVLEDDAPALALQRAACAAKVTPILSPRECAGCALRQTVATADRRPPTVVATDDERRRTNVAPRVAPAHLTPSPSPDRRGEQGEVARSNIVAAKIIQLQEWLAKQKRTPQQAEDDDAVRLIAVAPHPARAVSEEKRVGWTD